MSYVRIRCARIWCASRLKVWGDFTSFLQAGKMDFWAVRWSISSK